MFSSDLTFRPRLAVFNQHPLQQLHQAKLEVFERTGVQITHKKAKDILHGAGALADDDRVRISSWVVMDAVQQPASTHSLGQGIILEGSSFLQGR